MFGRAARAGLLPGLIISVVLIGAFLAPTPSTRLGPVTLQCYSYGVGCGTPTVTNVSPRFGPTTGGTFVTITGTNFNDTSVTVRFGSTIASGCTVVSDTQITCNSPAHSSGPVDVTVTTTHGTSATSPADRYTYLLAGAAKFKGRLPLRIDDTRLTAAFGPGETRSIQITGVGGVPGNATAVVLNVTVANTTAFSWLTVWPGCASQPVVSNLNWVAGIDIANLVQVRLGCGGQISINNAAGKANVILDLEGWFQPADNSTDGEFISIGPSRIADTRTGSGHPNAGQHLGPGSTVDIQVAGADGVSATTAEAVVLNATVTNTTAFSWLTCWPTGQSMPLASNLNWLKNESITNRVTIQLGAGGKISCNNALGNADLLIDANGWYTDATVGFFTGAFFFPLAPSRLKDTRSSSKVGPGGTLVVQIAGQGGVPPLCCNVSPTAVLLNVTATNHTGGYDWLTVYPHLTTLPNSSDLNFVAGQTIPNCVIVKIGNDGQVSITNAGGFTDILVDLNGYYGVENLG